MIGIRNRNRRNEQADTEVSVTDALATLEQSERVGEAPAVTARTDSPHSMAAAPFGPARGVRPSAPAPWDLPKRREFASVPVQPQARPQAAPTAANPRPKAQPKFTPTPPAGFPQAKTPPTRPDMRLSPQELAHIAFERDTTKSEQWENWLPLFAKTAAACHAERLYAAPLGAALADAEEPQAADENPAALWETQAKQTLAEIDQHHAEWLAKETERRRTAFEKIQREEQGL